MGAFDVTQLVQNTKLMEALPTGESAFLDTDIVYFLQVELQSTILPLHQRVNEEFFVKTMDFSFVPGSTSNSIIIPQTIGMRLRDVQFTNNPGQGGTPGFSNIPRLNWEDVANLGPTFTWNVNNFTTLFGFLIQNNTLWFFPPNILAGNTVRLKYFAQPAPLTLTSNGGRIISINVGANLITLDNAPTGWVANTVVDFIASQPPFDYVQNTNVVTPNYASVAPLTQVSIVAASGTTYQFAPGIVQMLSVGDYVAPTGYAQVPQYIPAECLNLLCEAAACRALRSLNDIEAEKAAMAKYEEMQENYLFLIEPRVQGKPKKFNNTDSILNSTRFSSLRPLN